MRNHIFAAAGAALCLATGAVAQSDAKKPTPAPAAAAAKPTPTFGQRKYASVFPVNAPKGVLEPLKAEEGVWDADVELYVGDPAKQPIRKKGVQTNRLVSNGHAMLNTMVYSDGSYEGNGMWGWDAYHNRYTGTWIDSESHLVRQDIGYYNPETKIFRWEADTMQPDGVTTRMQIVQQFNGDKRIFQINMMDVKTGEFKRLLVMNFTKRKS
jgi:hypothetical protein